MMNARLNKALVALLAVAAGACGDAPVDVAVSDPDRLVTNPSFVVIEAGETRLVQAYLVNALGNPVAGDVDIDACDASITVEEDPDQTDLEPGTNFLITGNTLGSSCVNLSGSGEEATVQVRVVPGSLEVALPATVNSGGTAQADVAFFDASGNLATGFDIGEIEFSSSDEDIAVVDENGVITGRAPGEVDIIATLVASAGASRADTFSIEVVPGTFGGTVTGDQGPGGTVLTFEITSGPGVDDDTEVMAEFGGDTYPLYPMEGTDANTYVTRLPYGVDAGVGSVSLINLGDEQVALNHPVEITAEAANDPHEPNQTFGTGTVITLPYNNILYQDGTDTEDRFLITVLDSTEVKITLDWDDSNGSHDLDLLTYIQNGAVFSNIAACTSATAAHPESATCILPPGLIGVRIDNYDADHGGAQGPTNYHLIIEVIEE